MNSNDIRRALETPDNAYRPLPFWFWNGDLTYEEIDRQLREMAAQGLGGAFVAPRQGMDVPYLSRAYFDRFRHAAETARSLGLSLWIYDEFPYPSGVSGGETLMRAPSLRQTKLEHIRETTGGGRVTLSLGRGVVLDARAVPLDAEGRADWTKALNLRDAVGVSPLEMVFQEDSGLTCYNLKRFFTYAPEMRIEAALPAGRWRVEACVQREIEDFKYFGGFIDPCDPAAADVFLQTTHERYAAAVGDLFGGVIPGIFTDETGLLGKTPWSRHLPNAYRERYGEPLEDRLCRMFDETAWDAAQTRDRVYRTIHEMLREHWHRPIAAWCRAHGLQYVAEVPGMRMTTQLYSDIVGGDFNHEKLGVPLDDIHDLHTANYRHNPTAIASLSRQLGRERALVESFHSIGWTMTLQDAKWGLDYIAACGINCFNFHAFFYSTAGLRKYDAPPSQFCQNPYWKHYRLFADFAARCALIGANTAATAEIALLEPTTSLWGLLTNPFDDYTYAGEDAGEMRRHEAIRDAWFRTRRALFHAQAGFEHLDAEMLARAEVDGGAAHVGKATYRALIMTACEVVEPETYAALWRFARGGGVLWLVGDAPTCLTDGSALPAPLPFARAFAPDDENALVDAVWARATPPLRCVPDTPRQCVSHLRVTDAGEPWLFVANQEGARLTGELILRAPWRAVRVIGCDGRPETVLNADQNGRAAFRLEPYESAWFAASSERFAPAPEPMLLTVPLDGRPLPFRLSGANWLRLARCEVSMNERDWTASAVKPYLLQREVMGALAAEDWQTSDGFGLPKRLSLRYPRTYSLRMRFIADSLPPDADIAFERDALLGAGDVFLNGTPLTNWREEAEQGVVYRVCPARDLLRIGENALRFRLTVGHDWEGLVDAAFVRGSFSVEIGGELPRLTAPHACAPFSTAYPCGAPHFSGEVAWEIAFDAHASSAPVAMRLQTAQTLADCVTLRLNGRSLGTRAFAPYRWLVPPDTLRDGENALRITIANTLAHRYEGRCFDDHQHALRDL